MQELVQYAQSIIAYLEQNGSNLNLESQQALVGMLQNALQVIQQQAQQEPQVPSQQQPLTEAMPSSNIEGFGYDDKTQSLLVRFLGQHPNRFGPIYAYQGVPREIFELFQKGAVPARTNGQNKWGKWWRGKKTSIGSALHHLIKIQGYPYNRLS